MCDTRTCRVGLAIKHVETLFNVGALDLDMQMALKCTQQRRVAAGTHGRSRPPAWVRKDLTGINGRAAVKMAKKSNRLHILLKRGFASDMEEAARLAFSRCASYCHSPMAQRMSYREQ